MPRKILFKLWRVKRWVVKKINRAFCLYMDVSNCNLRCATCPRGGVAGLKNEGRGLMDFELFKQIVNKFVNENVKIEYIEFGVWGEPLLNPDISKMISYAKSKPGFMTRKAQITIATNLTHLPNPAELLESGVDRFRISISGMTQEVYSKDHRGGNIKSVLNNILKLVDIRHRKKKVKKPELYLVFQELIYNKKEAELAKKFCDDHGLIFINRAMRITSVDENIRFQEEKERLTKFYSEFIDLKKEMSKMRTMDPKDIKNCGLLKDRVTINFDGQLYRCCCVFEGKHFMGSFFDFKVRDIPNIKSEICEKCAKTPISWR